jgi:P4 family phage/plasmid primase-like protien
MPGKTRLDLFLNGNEHGKTEKERYGRIVVETGKPFTHWSFDNKEKWWIDSDDLPEFYKLYCADLLNGVPRYMTEKSTPIGLARVDLDFKYEGEVDEHKHTREQVIAFAMAYMEELKKYVQVPEIVQLYILEKDVPTYDHVKQISSSGIHMQIPDVKTRSGVEMAVRRSLVKRMGDFFPNLGLTKGWEDVYDKQPLSHTNNWPLLGSKKKDGMPYRIRYVLDYDAQTGEISVDEDVPQIITPDLLKRMTVRSDESEETPLTEFGKQNTNAPVERAVSTTRGRPSVRPEHNSSRASSPTNRNYVEPLSESKYKYYEAHTMNLDEKRYKNYQEWISVGQCLKNIHPDLQDVWLDFSAQDSAQYNPREALAKWESFSFRTDGPKLSEGSLRHWSREDNFQKYVEIERLNEDSLVDIAASTSREYDVATLVHAMYRDEFVCSNYSRSDWYQFVGHYWRSTSKGVQLLMRFSSDIARKFLNKEERELQTLKMLQACEHAPNNPDTECEYCQTRQRKKSYNGIYTKLGQTKFKDNVLKECKELFIDEDFENKINNHKHLIAFNNGVYDLQKYEFRPGKADDYITLCTKIDFNMSVNHYEYECWPEVERFLRSILPYENVRRYYLRHLASCLAGGEGSQRFHILTGSGSNGKSMFTNLITKGFGSYATKVPVSLLTQKRNKAGAASPEILKMKGCRFGSMAEPDEGEPLSANVMKELSGGEAMAGRDLYASSKEMVDFMLQIRLHLACNEKPKVYSAEGGTWRRLVVVDFPSKFVMHPDPRKPNEHPMDESIDYKVNSIEWATCFMAYLVHLFKEGHGWRKLEPPKEVLEYTNEYQEEQDALAKFIHEYVHVPPTEDPTLTPDPVTKQMVTSAFQMWKRENEISRPGVGELTKRLESQFGKCPKNGWTSFRFGTGDPDS